MLNEGRTSSIDREVRLHRTLMELMISAKTYFGKSTGVHFAWLSKCLKNRWFGEFVQFNRLSYVRIGWTQTIMLFKWARQKRSRSTRWAKAAGLSLITVVPRSISSICSGDVDEVGVPWSGEEALVGWVVNAVCRYSSGTSILKIIDGTILSMCFQISFWRSSFAVLRIKAWWPRRPKQRNLNWARHAQCRSLIMQWQWCSLLDLIRFTVIMTKFSKTINEKFIISLIIWCFFSNFTIGLKLNEQGSIGCDHIECSASRTEAMACSISSRSFFSSRTNRRA